MVLVTNYKRISLLFTALFLLLSVSASAATFTVNPSSLSFSGNTGTSTVDSLTVTNYTGYPLLLTTTLSGNSSGYYSIPSLGSLTVPSYGTATLPVTFAPSATGNTSATLTLRSFAGDSVVVPISGSATTSGGNSSISLSPSGTINVNGKVGSTTSTPITITNLTASPLTGSASVSGSPAFTVGSSTLSLGANGTQTLNLNFTPTAVGTDTGTLTLSTLGGGTVTAHLVGTATASGSGTLHVQAPNTVNFNSLLGQSQCLPITIGNTTTNGVFLSNMKIVGDTGAFSVEGNDTSTINAGTNGSLTVCFHPQNLRNAAAELLFKAANVLDSTTNGTTTIHLSGTAQDTAHTGGPLPFFLVTRNIEFNNVVANTTVCQPVTLTNPQGQAVMIDSASVSGPYSTQYAVSGANNLNIAGNSTQYINVCFSANANTQGNQNGTLNVYYNIPGTSLSGSIPVRIEANTIDTTSGELTNCVYVQHGTGVIGPIVSGATTNGTIYLTNTSGNPITVSGATLSGANSSSFSVAGNQFPMVLTSGQQGQFNVSFAPTGTVTNPNYNSNITLTMSGASACNSVTIPVHAIAIPPVMDTVGVNLGTGLTSNGTNVIGITNTSNAGTCVNDTVMFTNTTNTAITLNNLLLPTNANLTLISNLNGSVIQPGMSVPAVIQFCANGQTNTTFTQPLYVATNQSILPQQFTVNAVALQAQAVRVVDLPTIDFAMSPNPASNDVTIDVNNVRSATVDIYDVLGNTVARLNGSHVRWDCRDINGIGMPSGTYIVRVVATDDLGQQYRSSKQLVLQK